MLDLDAEVIPMPIPDYEFGRHAIIAPGQQEKFNSCKDALVADTRPVNFLEKLIVDELLHAQWELLRVENAANNPESEAELLAASARATRNWQRAGRELAALQTARISVEMLTVGEESVDTPCADLTRVPRRKPATKSVGDWHLQVLMDRAEPLWRRQ